MLATLDGADALDEQLAALPAAVAARDSKRKARELAEALARESARRKAVGPGSGDAKSGALKASIVRPTSSSTASDVTATVGSFGDVKYAAIQEYGGRTAAHEILPDKAQALAFSSAAVRASRGGSSIPARRLPARAYLSCQPWRNAATRSSRNLRPPPPTPGASR